MFAMSNGNNEVQCLWLVQEKQRGPWFVLESLVRAKFDFGNYFWVERKSSFVVGMILVFYQF